MFCQRVKVDQQFIVTNSVIVIGIYAYANCGKVQLIIVTYCGKA